MKLNLPITLLALGLAFLPASLRAEDWKTNDGKVYQNVTVVSTAPDAVTILHEDGGALVPLANLPPNLQARFNYDPVKAQTAADARVKDDAENAKAMQAEMDKATLMRQAGVEPPAPTAPAQTDTETQTVTTDTDDSLAPLAPSATPSDCHHSEAEISGQPLQADPSDSTHHTMDEIAPMTQSLRRDLSDPDYHTMAHLGVAMHYLGPDRSDPNHYGMDNIP